MTYGIIILVTVVLSAIFAKLLGSTAEAWAVSSIILTFGIGVLMIKIMIEDKQ